MFKKIQKLLGGNKKCDIIFDSTGLKVYGEGEWKIKIHGKSKRRTWRKFHIGIDADSQDILCCELTCNNTGDAQVGEKMLRRLKRGVKSVRGDGAYDSGKFREKVHQKGGKCVIPSSEDAAYKYAEDGWEKERDESLEAIVGLGGGDRGRKLWKILSGYHRRSLVETMMYRIKKIFGPQLKARSLGPCCIIMFQAQVIENK